MKDIGKRARFMPFWIMLGILGLLLIGSFITPMKITLDTAFENIEDSATANGTPKLSCLSSEASGIMKATCFSLGGFVLVIIYMIYQWVTGMIAGSKAKGAIFAPRLRRMQQALEQ